MSERPKKKVVDYGQGHAMQRRTVGWNEAIDAYEQWEKENPRLERLDYEKVKNFLYANADGIYTMDNAADVSKNICQAFGQPKDAVSVPFECSHDTTGTYCAACDRKLPIKEL